MSDILLVRAAGALGDLTDEVVFVGAATVAFWIGQYGDLIPRITMDADTVIDVSTKSAYDRFGDRLRERGFEVDSGSRVIVRWIHRPTGLVLDVMPKSEEVFGFGGGWQAEALSHAVTIELSDGSRVRAGSPPYIVAMKLQAYRSRGRGDLLASHDFEDLINLIAAVSDLADLVQEAGPVISKFIGSELREILAEPRLDYAVTGTLSKFNDYERLAADVIDVKLPALAALEY